MEAASPYQLVQTRHGLMLANPNDVFLGLALIKYGEYCELEGQIFAHLLSLRPGMVIEAGANIGTHTIALAKALATRNRELVAFEPQPFIFQNLCANLALNGITNARAWPMACGAQTETVFFPAPDYAQQGNFGGIAMQTDLPAQAISAPCVRLDDMLGDDQVGLIKVDVEGFELLALQGAINILTRSRPVLYVENDRIEQSEALIDWLWSQNYQLWWHIPPLFNPDNFFKDATNIYGNTASFNMLGLPRELNIAVNGLKEITSAADHPLAGR